MKLEKKLISLKSAKKLKELGFNIPTYYAYSPLGHIYCCGDLVDYNNYEDVLEWTSIPSLEDLLIFLDEYDFSLLYSADTEGWYFLTIALDNKVIFGGRLGQYKYFDMDKVIVEALKISKEELN